MVGGARFCWLVASALVPALSGGAFAFQAAPINSAAGYDALAQSLVERARDEVAQVKSLVEKGALPRVRLLDAQSHLDDAEDELILTQTLYGPTRLQEMTDQQARDMVNAASRRVERERKIVVNEETLMNSGILARSDLSSFEDELQSRERVLDLANNRARLLKELREMAEVEQRLEHNALSASAAALSGIMIRYNGSGFFNMAQLPSISKQFERKFGRPLPISAMGETMLHRSMGLDHRNRVDVSLNPDGAEGIWLRQLLERLRIPYLAFRAAVVGAATAPHIHIGTGSTRLSIAQR